MLLLPLLFSCSSDDASITSVEKVIFVEHYKTTSLLNGTAFVIFENGAPGNSDLRIRAQIDGFNFEPGYTYLINTNKIVTKNAGTNATTVRYEFLNELTKEPAENGAKFRVPLIEFVNGQGTVSFLRRKQDSTFVISNEITVNCEFVCSELHSAFEANTPIVGVFMHGDSGNYILSELQ